jgi:hypothetical protein
MKQSFAFLYFFNVIRSSDLIIFLSLCILLYISETVCDKGTSLVLFKRFYEKSYSSDNIESNTKTFFTKVILRQILILRLKLHLR